MQRRRKMKVGPVPPPQPKVPKPDKHELKDIYKKLVSANVSVRTSTFFAAIDWWDKAIPFLIAKSPLKTPEQLKKFGQINKSRNLAIGGATEHEKEAAALRTLALLEKLWDKESIPSYKPYYEQYEQSKKALEDKEAAAAARFQVVLEALNSAFKPLNLEFQLVKQTNSGKIREYDGAGKMLLSMALAKELNQKVKTEGLLPALFSEVKSAITAYGIETVNDPAAPGGIRHAPNVKRMLEGLPLALDGVMQYVNSAPRAKIFKQYSGTLEATAAAASTPTVKIPHVKIPRTTTASNGTKTAKVHVPRSGSGPLVGGRYQPGTSCAILYESLSDQKTHSLTDILKGLNVNNPQDRLRYLVKHGDRSGKWKVIIHGNTIQMVIP